MKTYLKLVPALLFVPLLTSCRNATYVSKVMKYELGTQVSMTSSRISYSVQRAEGDATYHFTIKKSHSLDMSMKYTVEFGALTVKAMKEDGTEFYQSIIVEDQENIISFEDYGSYKISIHYDDFKGTYLFDWSK